ncbi:MAG: glutaredoxin family protein [Candidatus Cloacimonetes bacterium]|nr:glutaredoxin family protein [Candidatus Cloacimonadota bacterium]MCF7812974.1 glutaredoxin family protein [Candidatus Cloacimonadota bacterium]MCF7867294.1 glutaredoxin family protein [Candidatus Cloacimonadota bacterium]MCF7882738.1 glutaredoxin family protein [Candidatus Cloacimonadota bacterium]
MKKMKKVIVFSTPTCSWCRKLKSYLKENKIKFKDIDVSRDQKAAQDMMRKTGQQGVPQMWINNVPVVGFDQKKIDKLLEIRQ